MAAGNYPLVAAVVADRCGLRINLYYVGGFYRMMASGIGWAPDKWSDRGKALERLISCKSYSQKEAEMFRRVCRENP